MDAKWRFKAHELIKRIAAATAEGMGATIDTHIDIGYPSVINNVELNDRAAHLLRN